MNDRMPSVTPIVVSSWPAALPAQPRVCCWLRGRAGSREKRGRSRWVALPTLSVRGTLGSSKRAGRSGGKPHPP